MIVGMGAIPSARKSRVCACNASGLNPITGEHLGGLGDPLRPMYHGGVGGLHIKLSFACGRIEFTFSIF